MDPLQQAKAEAITVVLTLALIFGMLPIKVRKALVEQTRIPQNYTSIILSSCLCFGAGVLLATTFLHMLPENQDHFQTLIADGIISMVNYPLSELVMCLGFLFIYLTEELVHLWVHRHPVAGHGNHSCSMHFNDSYEIETTPDSTNLYNSAVFPNSPTSDQVSPSSRNHTAEISHKHDPGHSHQHDPGHSHQHHIGHSHQHHQGHSHKHQGHSHVNHGHSHQHYPAEKTLNKVSQHSEGGAVKEFPSNILNGHISKPNELVNYQQCFCDTVHDSKNLQSVDKGSSCTERCSQRVENDINKKFNDCEALVPQKEYLSPCELMQNPVLNRNKKRCESTTSVSIITGCLDQHPSTLCAQSTTICLEDSQEIHTDHQNYETVVEEEKLLVPSARGTLVRSVLLVLALSFHGIFEGLALGLERSVAGVWIFCLAICLHKVFISFSIGMELLELNISFKLYVLHMVVFSISSPLGATIGTILFATISEESAVGLTTLTILEGISTGTILYVTFCEVLERERTKVEGRFYKYLALVLGFGIMAGLFTIKEPSK